MEKDKNLEVKIGFYISTTGTIEGKNEIERRNLITTAGKLNLA